MTQNWFLKVLIIEQPLARITKGKDRISQMDKTQNKKRDILYI